MRKFDGFVETAQPALPTPSRGQVLSAIRKFLSTTPGQNGDSALSDDEPLIENGHMTSLQAVELVLFLEERFSLRIQPEDVSEENFFSMNCVTDLVMSRIRGE